MNVNRVSVSVCGVCGVHYLFVGQGRTVGLGINTNGLGLGLGMWSRCGWAGRQ